MRPRPSVILDTVVDGVFRTAILLSVFLLFAGHNAPGGGFVGGLVAVAALILLFVAGGRPAVKRATRLRPTTLLGSGLAVAAATGFGGWLWGRSFLDQATAEIGLVVLGKVKVTTALLFDVGVYLVVVGLGLAVLGSLGGEVEEEPSA